MNTATHAGHAQEPLTGAPLPVRRVSRKRALALGALIFCCGMVVGVGGTVLAALTWVRQLTQTPEQTVTRLAQRTQADLGLSESQRATGDDIIARHFATLFDIKRQMYPRLKTELDSLQTEMNAVLTPEQQTLWTPRFNRFCRMVPFLRLPPNAPPPVTNQAPPGS